MSDVLCNIWIHIVTQFNSLYMIVNLYLPDDGFLSQNM
jgi:hypothetical protein